MTTNTLVTGATAQNWNFTWDIVGGGTIPASNTYTDGYKITSKTTTVDVSTADNWKNVCVQYLDSAGAAMPATDTAQGAPFLCVQAQVAAANGNQNVIAMKTQTHAAMACHVSGSTCTATANGGTALPAGAVETWTGGAGVVASAFAAATMKQCDWWQPTQSSDYASALRRYSAGDKVRVFNVALIGNAAVATALTTANLGTAGAAVTLVGATSLAAGAVALGAAALAF